MRHFNLNDTQKSCIVSSYHAGLTLSEIGDIVGSSQFTVRDYINSLGLPPRPRGPRSKGLGEAIYEPPPYPKVDPMAKAFAANPALARVYRLGVSA